MAPELPAILRRRISRPDEPARRRAHFRWGEREKPLPPLERLVVFAEQDGPRSGRNELCFETALRAAREGYSYTQDEVSAFLSTHPLTAGHKQIRSAVRSAFRYQKKRLDPCSILTKSRSSTA
jgi:hypothetical protein